MYLPFRQPVFQSTHPTRGCDPSSVYSKSARYISIHAPHEGVRPRGVFMRDSTNNFNPRTPRGGATRQFQEGVLQLGFQSTHPTRGCDIGGKGTSTRIIISIHAPHEGVRRYAGYIRHKVYYFNPRTPRGGATITHRLGGKSSIFQSTHPTRGCDRNRNKPP